MDDVRFKRGAIIVIYHSTIPAMRRPLCPATCGPSADQRTSKPNRCASIAVSKSHHCLPHRQHNPAHNRAPRARQSSAIPPQAWPADRRSHSPAVGTFSPHCRIPVRRRSISPLPGTPNHCRTLRRRHRTGLRRRPADIAPASGSQSPPDSKHRNRCPPAPGTDTRADIAACRPRGRTGTAAVCPQSLAAGRPDTDRSASGLSCMSAPVDTAPWSNGPRATGTTDRPDTRCPRTDRDTGISGNRCAHRERNPPDNTCDTRRPGIR